MNGQSVGTWRDAVIQALHRYCQRHETRTIDRGAFLGEEISHMMRDVGSVGKTPGQTVSRILQELREEKLIAFLQSGKYLLADSPLTIESEDLPDDALDFAIEEGKLSFSNLAVGDATVLMRQRKGQDRIRVKTIWNYGGRCAFCDVASVELLEAAHISRWADDVKNRGNLHNVICMCKFHHPLFEQGYFTLNDDCGILIKIKPPTSSLVSEILNFHTAWQAPNHFTPWPELLKEHRKRFGFI